MDALLKRHHTSLWWIVLMFACLPGALLGYDYLNHNLGTNGLEMLERTTGRWAVICLIATLSITPARWSLTLAARTLALTWGKRLADWNILMRMRRMLGLTCFGYALAHAYLYLEFDLGFDWSFLLEDLKEKPYMLVGAINLALLSLLAITSTDNMMRSLKQNWRRIHRLIYLIALLAMAHWWWMSKPGDLRSLPYQITLATLLVWRIPHAMGLLKLPDDNGMEVPERIEKS